jgi:hypothetical protein
VLLKPTNTVSMLGVVDLFSLLPALIVVVGRCG